MKNFISFSLSQFTISELASDMPSLLRFSYDMCVHRIKKHIYLCLQHIIAIAKKLWIVTFQQGQQESGQVHHLRRKIHILLLELHPYKHDKALTT